MLLVRKPVFYEEFDDVTRVTFSLFRFVKNSFRYENVQVTAQSIFFERLKTINTKIGDLTHFRFVAGLLYHPFYLTRRTLL